MHMYEQDLALNNLEMFICHKIQPNTQKQMLRFVIDTDCVVK